MLAACAAPLSPESPLWDSQCLACLMGKIPHLTNSERMRRAPEIPIKRAGPRTRPSGRGCRAGLRIQLAHVGRRARGGGSAGGAPTCTAVEGGAGRGFCYYYYSSIRSRRFQNDFIVFFFSLPIYTAGYFYRSKSGSEAPTHRTSSKATLGTRANSLQGRSSRPLL